MTRGKKFLDMEVNMVKLQSETRLAEKKQFTKSNLLSEF